MNNMLAGITGNLYLAKQHIQDMPDVEQKLTNVEVLSMRAADMIQQLLTFARKSVVDMKPLPLTPFIKETLQLIHSSVPENIKIHMDICNDALRINGDGTQLHQVLMNFISNACDAVEGEDHPCITVSLEEFHVDDAFVKRRAYFKIGSYAHISVTDNGCGISENQLKHLFEPFFTTKEQGKGTGLGLAMVFGAVKTHHGFVEVDSILEEGSTFHIYIPLLGREDLVSVSMHYEKVSRHGYGEVILLADDQELVLEIGKEVLEKLGYQVLTAIDGQQAVEIFKANAEDIDLCIFDIIMPVMDGNRAVQLIREIKPQVKVIFSTGYDKLSRSDMRHETVISKPFPIEELSRLIRQKLDDSAHRL